MTRKRSITPIVTMLLMVSMVLVCCKEVSTPKPRGYFRIEFPEHEYSTFNETSRAFSFEHSKLSRIARERDLRADTTWINIFYPTLDCKIHLTYMRLNKKDEDKAYDDSYRLAYKHSVMADAIGERYYDNEERKVYATFYDIKGNAATPSQFSITDSCGQFFRGSLYFNCRPNKDSLEPVISYVNEDIIHLIETFNWK